MSPPDSELITQLGNTSKDLESRNSKSEAMIHACRHNWRWSLFMLPLVASDKMPKLLPKCPINISRASTDKCSATAAKHFTTTLANCPRSDDGAESSSKSCASCFVSASVIFCFDKAEALCSAQLGRTCARMLQAAMGKTKAVSTLLGCGSSSHCAKRFLVGWTNPTEKYESQIGSFPQIGMNIKNVWNHHPVKSCLVNR